jgi:hypothetical protein
MATKKNNAPAAAPAFTITYGTTVVTLPLTYKPDPRYGTLADADYKGMKKGPGDEGLLDALNQLADVLEDDPTAYGLPATTTPAAIRAITGNFSQSRQAMADHTAAGIELSRLYQLDRDAAATLASDTRAIILAVTRKNPALAARVARLINLNKRG